MCIRDSYKDVAHGISYLSSNSMLGRYALVLSPELYLELERLQPNVGLLELDRIAKLVGGRAVSYTHLDVYKRQVGGGLVQDMTGLHRVFRVIGQVPGGFWQGLI